MWIFYAFPKLFMSSPKKTSNVYLHEGWCDHVEFQTLITSSSHVIVTCVLDFIMNTEPLDNKCKKNESVLTLNEGPKLC